MTLPEPYETRGRNKRRYWKRVFESGDWRLLKKGVQNPQSDEVVEISFHKMRHEATYVSAALRLESREWLQSRGYKRYKNMPWPFPGVLPD